MMGKTVPEAKINQAKKEMEATLNLFTKLWLTDTQFIAGDDITVADIAATEIEQLGDMIRTMNDIHLWKNFIFLSDFIGPTNYNAFEGRPQLKQWIDRVKSKTNPHYDDAHKMIYKVAALNKAKL